MRLVPRAGILILFVFLIASSALAERIHNDQFDFSVTIPDGFTRQPEIESQSEKYLYVYRKTDTTGPGDAIVIQHMGGVIGRDHLGADGKLPGHADAVFTRRWNGFDVDVAEVPESVSGIATITYNVLVPLKPEAIKISVAGVREHKEALLSELQYLLNNTDGQSNWLRTLMSSTPASEYRNRVFELVVAIVFLIVSFASIWLVARRKPGHAIIISVAFYTTSWFVPTADVAELHFAAGLLRMTGLLGIVLGLFYVYRLKRTQESVVLNPEGREDSLQQGLSIALRCSWLWQSLFYICKPNVEVDGNTYTAAWGHFELPMEPGSHRLRIYFPYFMKPECGMSSTEIQVDANRVTRVSYRAPYTVFQPGTLIIEER